MRMQNKNENRSPEWWPGNIKTLIEKKKDAHQKVGINTKQGRLQSIHKVESIVYKRSCEK